MGVFGEHGSIVRSKSTTRLLLGSSVPGRLKLRAAANKIDSFPKTIMQQKHTGEFCTCVIPGYCKWNCAVLLFDLSFKAFPIVVPSRPG